MLTHPMLDQLDQLGLSGMAQAFAELEASDETATLSHADWLGLLVDRELTHRRDKRLAARLRYARLRQPASVDVPQAKVLNVVAGPRHGDSLEVSVSLLRVGDTSELRLHLEHSDSGWLVTDVRG